MKRQLSNAMRNLFNKLCVMIAGIILFGSVSATETITYFHNDVVGSPVVATDQNGSVVWKESYRPYGEQLQKQAASTNNRLWFAGKSFEQSSGLSYSGARYYDPMLGRFMGIDPVGFKEENFQSFNRYAYANNNPYRYTDPDGRELAEVNLPGLGKTYLDDTFSPKVTTFIEKAKAAGVDLNFNSAYRSPEKQADLKNDKSAITPADVSLHSAGFAVDVNFTSLSDIKDGLTGDKQREAIKAAAKDAGLSWGGNFKKADPPHFYVEPAGKRQDAVDAATKKYNELTAPK